MNPPRPSAIAMITLAVIALCAACAGADAIRLKTSVRLPRGADAVRLADIADLDGPEARAFADLVVADVVDPSFPLELHIRRVRALLHEAGAHWGHINLSGKKVVVRPRFAPSSGPPAAMRGDSLVAVRTSPREITGERNPGIDDHLAAAIIDAPTLRGELARFIVEALNAPPQRLRLLFDTTDAQTLEASSDDFRFELKPESRAASERVVFTARLWKDGRVADSRQIALRPLVLVDTAVLRREIARDETIDPQDVDVQPRWLAPPQAAIVCSPEGAAGRVASRRLNAGDLLRDKHVRRQTLIQRGDRVAVRCLVGGVVISLQAEACQHGVEGQTIECRKLGERDTFIATVTARGEAVIDLARTPSAAHPLPADHRPSTTDTTEDEVIP